MISKNVKNVKHLRLILTLSDSEEKLGKALNSSGFT